MVTYVVSLLVALLSTFKAAEKLVFFLSLALVFSEEGAETEGVEVIGAGGGGGGGGWWCLLSSLYPLSVLFKDCNGRRVETFPYELRAGPVGYVCLSVPESS